MRNDPSIIGDIVANEHILASAKARRISLWRKAVELGYTQEEIGKAAGLSRQYVGKVMRDNGIHMRYRIVTDES